MVETKPSKHLEYQTVQGIDMERVLLFSDAIFAFAITLLAMDIRVPQDLASQLNDQIYALLPKFISFLLSYYRLLSKLRILKNKYHLPIRRNVWDRNYWDEPQILPYMIPGVFIKTTFQIDWRPASKPYQI